VPSAVAHDTETGELEACERQTSTSASVPSIAELSPTLMVGVSRMVTTPVPSPIVSPSGSASTTLTVSSPSRTPATVVWM